MTSSEPPDPLHDIEEAIGNAFNTVADAVHDAAKQAYTDVADAARTVADTVSEVVDETVEPFVRGFDYMRSGEIPVNAVDTGDVIDAPADEVDDTPSNSVDHLNADILLEPGIDTSFMFKDAADSDLTAEIRNVAAVLDGPPKPEDEDLLDYVSDGEGIIADDSVCFDDLGIGASVSYDDGFDIF